MTFLVNFRDLLRKNPRPILFGMLHTFSSSYGQTFFIALFYTQILKEFSLTKTEYGMLYGLATLCSGLTLPWVSPLIDKLSPRRISLVNSTICLCAIVLLMNATTLFQLGCALLGLRLSGQGLMQAIASTVVSKHFNRSRGTALSLLSLGQPIGEALLPLLIISALRTHTWNETWMIPLIGLGGLVLLQLLLTERPFLVEVPGRVDVPATIELPSLSSASVSGAIPLASKAVSQNDNDIDIREQQNQSDSWNRREALRSSAFWMLIPFWITPGFLLTGYFFHKLSLAEERAWSLEWMALCFFAFAIARIFASLIAGPIVDRIGAARLLPSSIMLMALGFLILVLLDTQWTGFAYLALQGFGIGYSGTVKTSYLADAFGNDHLGAIKGFVMGLAVIGTSLSPLLFGWALENGFDFRYISGASVMMIVLTSFLAWVGVRRLRFLNSKRA